jgi:hypothetical protein
MKITVKIFRYTAAQETIWEWEQMFGGYCAVLEEVVVYFSKFYFPFLFSSL